nr:TatD family hydrolase [Microthrixaceae bacterium]
MNDSARTEIEWFDSHCHLDGEEDPATVVADAAAAGVVGMVTVGTDGASSAVALELARSIGRVWATAGVHPHEAEHGIERLQEVVAEAVEAADGRLVAIGECGLDYHYDHSPREAQRRVFAEQVEMAHRFDLP